VVQESPGGYLVFDEPEKHSTLNITLKSRKYDTKAPKHKLSPTMFGTDSKSIGSRW
jgi:hypothetical protein